MHEEQQNAEVSDVVGGDPAEPIDVKLCEQVVAEHKSDCDCSQKIEIGQIAGSEILHCRGDRANRVGTAEARALHLKIGTRETPFVNVVIH
jgi:hypothetical protein